MQIKSIGSTSKVKNCFQIAAQRKTFTWIAPSELEKKEWMEALTDVINCQQRNALERGELISKYSERYTKQSG